MKITRMMKGNSMPRKEMKRVWLLHCCQFALLKQMQQRHKIQGQRKVI